MLDIAIVGSGLCGLALADSLQTLGRDYALFDARERAGGRIRSVRSASTGAMLDLGPAWFWPESDTSMAGLVATLGLASFPQHDDGTAVQLKEAAGKLETFAAPNLHAGAHRLQGGMAALVQALVDRLPANALRLGHVLEALCDRGDHVELLFRCGDQALTVQARRVVLALPPRLVDEGVRCEPALPEALRQTLRGTPTWMGGAAKVAIAYPRPYWREAGHSGNAFVTHEQAALAEVFDACDAGAEQAALGAFLALGPALREQFSAGLSMLMHNQLMQLFGPELEHGELHFQDWAREAHTASALDRTEPQDPDPAYGHPLLAEALWDGKLFLGGSETAAHGGGRLEGALTAAGRLRRALVPAQPSHGEPLAVSGAANARCLGEFGDWVAQQRSQAFEHYRRCVNRALAAQRREQITQRAVLETVESLYRAALARLAEMPLDMREVAIRQGRSDLTPHALQPFLGFSDALLDEAVRFNRSSCALSNFPVEHDPGPDYMHVIRRDLAATWRDFALAANDRLLARCDPEALATALQ